MNKLFHSFTLIELLVVIGIIAVLASLLQPAVVKARLKAREIQCVSNYKQQALAVEMYLNDNRAFFPDLNGGFLAEIYWDTGKQATSEEDSFGNQQPYLAPYVEDTRVFLCPTSQGTERERFCQDSTVSTALFGKRRTAIPGKGDWPKSLSRCAILVESCHEWLQADSPERLRCGHQGSTVVSFLDGHVSALHGDSLRQREDARIFGFLWDEETVHFTGDESAPQAEGTAGAR